MKSRIVNISSLINNSRFDGSYHNADINVYDDVINAHSKHNLGYYCSTIYTGTRGRRVYTTKDYGVPFLGNTDVVTTDPFINCNYSSRKYGFDNSALLKGGMILTGRVGSIGQTAFVPDYWEKKHAMGSDNVLIINVKPSYYNGFIYAFLASKMGNLSFWKHAAGSVQPYITDKMVSELPIPVFPDAFQKRIDDKIKKSAKLREEANDSLEKAVSIMEENIGKTKFDWSMKYNRISAQKIRGKFFRLDAQYQISKDNFEDEKKKNIGYKKISTFSKRIFVGNRGKRIYVEKGIDFLSSSDMMLFNSKRFCKQISDRTPGLKEMLVKSGDILISRSGTIGNAIIVGDYLDGAAVSEHALKLVIDDTLIDPKYVFCYLKTKQAKMIMEGDAYGSVIITLGEDYVADIDLPILPEKERTSICEKIGQYISKQDMAEELELSAISEVESEIESWGKHKTH